MAPPVLTGFDFAHAAGWLSQQPTRKPRQIMPPTAEHGVPISIRRAGTFKPTPEMRTRFSVILIPYSELIRINIPGESTVDRSRTEYYYDPLGFCKPSSSRKYLGIIALDVTSAYDGTMLRDARGIGLSMFAGTLGNQAPRATSLKMLRYRTLCREVRILVGIIPRSLQCFKFFFALMMTLAIVPQVISNSTLLSTDY